MCIDILEIWFEIANGKILLMFDRVICPPHMGYYSLTLILCVVSKQKYIEHIENDHRCQCFDF